jgi:hypothetical protein
MALRPSWRRLIKDAQPELVTVIQLNHLSGPTAASTQLSTQWNTASSCTATRLQPTTRATKATAPPGDNIISRLDPFPLVVAPADGGGQAGQGCLKDLYIVQPPLRGGEGEGEGEGERWVVKKLYWCRVLPGSDDRLDYLLDPREGQDFVPGCPLVSVDLARDEVCVVGLHNGRGERARHHHGVLLIPHLAAVQARAEGTAAHGGARRRRISSYDASNFERWPGRDNVWKKNNMLSKTQLNMISTLNVTTHVPADDPELSAELASSAEARGVRLLLKLLEQFPFHRFLQEHALMSLAKILARKPDVVGAHSPASGVHHSVVVA